MTRRPRVRLQHPQYMGRSELADAMAAAKAMGTRRRRKGPSSAEIAAYAVDNVECTGCGVPAGDLCTAELEPPRTVCRERFIAAANELRNAARGAAEDV